MGPWEVMYILVMVFLVCISIVIFLPYSKKIIIKENIPQKLEIYGNKFEHGIPLFRNYMRIIYEAKIKLYDCICHNQNNTYPKYHELKN